MVGTIDYSPEADIFELAWSFATTQVRVGKVTQGGAGGPFAFTYTNAAPAPQNITTGSAGAVTYTSSGYSPVTDNSASIVVNETSLASPYVFKSVTCVNDTTGATIISNQTASSTATITTGTVGTGANMYDPGDQITCTYTNARTNLTLQKTVINDNGGTALPTAWTLAASGPTPLSGTTGSAAVTGAPVTAGTYTLGESGPANYIASPYSCVKNGGAAVNGNSITLAAGDTAVCTITNNDSNQADLSVTKTNSTGTVVSGTKTTYTIVVSNQGPALASGAVVSDTPGSGLSSCSVTNATAANGAVAPASGTWGSLFTGGVAIPTLPSGGSVTFTVQCTVP